MKANYERTTRIGKEDYLVTLAFIILFACVFCTVRYCGTKAPVTTEIRKADVTVELDTIAAPYGFVESEASEEYKLFVIKYKNQQLKP